MKTYLIFTTSIFLSICSLAQNGPGGVGMGAGPTLDIWLNETGHVITGGLLSQWSDASGNNNHLTQTDPTFRPAVAGAFNGISVVEFSTDEITINYDISPAARPDITVITVVDHNTAATSPLSKVFGHDDSGYDRTIGFDTRCAANTFKYFGNSFSQCFFSPAANVPFIVNAEYSATNFSGWFNGNKLIDNVANTNGGGEAVLTVGGITDRGGAQSYNEFWNGAIAEFILYNSPINDAQHIILQNYLSAKYGTTLAGNDLYDEDDVANGNYDFDVAGIGRFSATELHTDSRGTGIVRINGATSLDDGDYLFWGHDNDILGAYGSTDCPPTIQAKFHRIWRASETGEVGNINISFDLSGLGTVTVSDLRLLVDTDNDGVFADETPIAGAVDLGGNVYGFNGISQINDNLRFTLGTINYFQTPLPVDLTEFTATPTIKRTVHLNWKTLTEKSSDYFRIEKSKDANDWEFVGQVKAAGNSSSENQYQLIDENPFSGTSYYRLIQFDFDGVETTSEVQSITFEEERKLEIYPNPAKGFVVIRGHDLQELKFFNALGQNISHQIKFNSENEQQVEINPSSLSKGVYFVQNGNQVKRLILE